jgi:hypothetical protein
MQQLKVKHIYAGVLLVILLLAFYWFALRPAQARKSCAKQANEQRENRWDIFYSICMKEKGIGDDFIFSKE